jgi:signal peptidase I
MTEQDAEQPKDDASKDDAPIVHTATLSEPKAKPGTGGKTTAKVKLSRKERKAQAQREYKHLRSQYNSWWAYYHAEVIVKPYGSIPRWLWKGTILPIGSVIILVVVFRSMLLDWNDVPSGSMEPEIHVGDRIAVNRLAYGLQFPLTGPQIGVPFTPLQWDNPLDGIPQLEWGDGPQHGDIVTFWNPVTKVRMVKRIVAGPGDTIEIRNSEMTINGQAASYTDLDAVDEGLPLVTRYTVEDQFGKSKIKKEDVEYRTEVLIDQTRTVQFIRDRWVDGYALLEKPDGQKQEVSDDTVIVTEQKQVASPIDPTQLVTMKVKKKVQLDTYLANNPSVRVVLRLKDGAVYLNNKAVSHNDFTAFLLKRYQTGIEADLLSKIGLAVKGHDFIVDGKTVFSEYFDQALRARLGQLAQDEREALRFAFIDDYNLIRSALSTNFGPYTVPEDSYLMIGDNRNNSSDGRFFGPVKRSEITGKAFAVAFSFNDNKMFALPPDPAWERFFKDLD